MKKGTSPNCVSYILTLMCKSVKFNVPNSACYSAVRILLIKVPCCNIMEAASDILYFWQSFLIQKSTDVWQPASSFLLLFVSVCVYRLLFFRRAVTRIRWYWNDSQPLEHTVKAPSSSAKCSCLSIEFEQEVVTSGSCSKILTKFG